MRKNKKIRKRIRIVGFIESLEIGKFSILIGLKSIKGFHFSLKIQGKPRSLAYVKNDLEEMKKQRQRLLFNGRNLLPIPGPIRNRVTV